MNISTINFDSFQKLKDEDCQERIIKAKKILGKDLLRLRIDPSAESYWIKREPPGPVADSLNNQF